VATVDATNTGRVDASWTEAEGVYGLAWDRFAPEPNTTHEDGGIVRDLDAHGSTGLGDARLPKVHYLSAGWGPTRIQLNNQTFKDPVLANLTFHAHYMVLRDGVRDPISHKIFAHNGKDLYDPIQPDDARIYRGSPEVLLVLKSTNKGLPAATTKHVVSGGTMMPSQGAVSKTKVLVDPLQDRLGVWVNASGPSAGQGVARLKDPDGNPVGQEQPIGSIRVQQAKWEVEKPMAGNWTVEVSQQAPGVAYRVDWVQHRPRVDPWFRMLTFEAPMIQGVGAGSTSAST
jgi:hypothetical protein